MPNGLSAQQVEECFPELALEHDGWKAYSPTDLIFVLINAVKTLAAEVDELKGQRA